MLSILCHVLLFVIFSPSVFRSYYQSVPSTTPVPSNISRQSQKSITKKMSEMSIHKVHIHVHVSIEFLLLFVQCNVKGGISLTLLLVNKALNYYSYVFYLLCITKNCMMMSHYSCASIAKTYSDENFWQAIVPCNYKVRAFWDFRYSQVDSDAF